MSLIEQTENKSAILQSKETVMIKKNDVVYYPDQKIENIYVILSGLIESVEKKNKKNKDKFLLKKGSTLGLMDLLLNRNYSKLMVAKNTTILAVIKKNTIFNTIKPGDYKSILLKSLAIDVDNKHPNTWS
ncbi:MAG: cyclic nucleotide-binding domain-containing protein [Rickettsiales bacterium TMED254]|nr:hypothetical protein [Rickettsiales bacterium]RPF77248.1 MAG: cyclic nucleotide-binding domain-containing protein [Rickettsiales bacterium TMED254]